MRLFAELCIWIAAFVAGIITLLWWSLALSPHGGAHFGLDRIAFVPPILALTLGAWAFKLSRPRLRALWQDPSHKKH